MRRKKALITGISGQDGAYLAKFLLGKGYEVYGTSRDAERTRFSNLRQLGIHDQIELASMTLNDFRSVIQILARVSPEEVYNLAGQSAVGLSFEQPVETMESVTLGTLNLLEAIRFLDHPIRLYSAGSGECFGDTSDRPATLGAPFRPRSPYGVAKAAAHWEIVNYREAYGLFACSGILFNHDSPLRPERFVTQKIVQGACRIAAGRQETLRLGNLDVERDWGWAPEYVEAMWLMLQQEEPQDFIVATGESYSLRDFLAAAFRNVGLDWQDYVVQNDSLFRASDIRRSSADPQATWDALGWQAQSKMPEVVDKMMEAAKSQLPQAAQ